MKFLIPLKFALSQDFLTSAGNMVLSTKFMGFGLKWDTSDFDSPKTGNTFFNYFYNNLKDLV